MQGRLNSKPITASCSMLVFGSWASADETLYRYEGDVLPYDASAGWEIFNFCEAPCSESLQDGHFVLQWPEAGDFVNYNLLFGSEPEVPPPPTLWVEWRFRSNHPLVTSTVCDARFVVDYKEIVAVVNMYGDAVISFDGGSFVTGMDIDAFHTYRFESLDGTNFTIAVDGQVFLITQDVGSNPFHLLQMQGRGGCIGDEIPDSVNEWDFVRYGTLDSGERVVSADPPSGPLDPVQHAGLDRFAVTFDAANFVYLDEVTVEVSSGTPPTVTQIWRRENDEPDTLEIVLDAPLDPTALTRFIINDGVSTDIIEYSFTGACCQEEGICSLLSEEDCAASGGTFLGAGVLCSGDNDDNGQDDACEFGPCCFSDGSCAEEFRSVCTATPDAKFHLNGNCQGDNNGNNIDERCEVQIPTTSEWGLAVLTLAMLIVGTRIIKRRTWQDI